MKVKFNSAIILNDNLKTIDFNVSKPEIIFKLLTEGLYENPLHSMVREYISNARDAHREKGNTKTPIKVGITMENGQYIFFVKDFGPGLSPKRLRQNFTTLGASTKSRSSNFIGGFGIGSKVGFAYSSIFTVINRYKGKKTVYSAIKEALPKLVELHSETIDLDDTGLEIRVPLKPDDVMDAISAIYMYTTCWHLNPFVDENVEYIFDESLKHYVDYVKSTYVDHFYFIDKDTIVCASDVPIVFVDYIPYKTTSDNVFSYSMFVTTTNLSIDDVTLTVSRESIQTIHKVINPDELEDKFYNWLIKQPYDIIKRLSAQKFLIQQTLKRIDNLTVRMDKYAYSYNYIYTLNDKYFKYKYDRFFNQLHKEGYAVIIPKSQSSLVPKQLVKDIPDTYAEEVFKSVYKSETKVTDISPEFIQVGDIKVPKYMWKNSYWAFNIKQLMNLPIKLNLNKRQFKKLYNIKEEPDVYLQKLYDKLYIYKSKQQAEALIQNEMKVFDMISITFSSLYKDKNLSDETKLYIFDTYIKPEIVSFFETSYTLGNLTEDERRKYAQKFIDKIYDQLKGGNK